MGIYYSYHDLYPESILIRDFAGKVGVDEIIESWKYLITNNMISDATKGIINNISSCALHMNMENFKILINFLKTQDLLKKTKLAVICDNPKTIVFPALGESKEDELKIKPFSTMNAAVSWVLE